MQRCSWATNERLIKYHDEEWGVPLHDDTKLFELLVLELFQAGLSWDGILKTREEMKKVFYDFDISINANLTDEYLESLMKHEGIIKNRRKIFSVRQNAKSIFDIKKKHGSFNAYLWKFTDNKTIASHPKPSDEIISKNSLSDLVSKDFKKNGITGLGSITVYSFLEAAGLLNNHITNCFLSLQKTV